MDDIAFFDNEEELIFKLKQQRKSMANNKPTIKDLVSKIVEFSTIRNPSEFERNEFIINVNQLQKCIDNI